MKAFSITALTSAIVLLGMSVAPAFANESDAEETINGRSKFAIEAALRDRGVETTGVEEWGGLIRAWVPNENGGTSMQLFDADTLQPVSPART